MSFLNMSSFKNLFIKKFFVGFIITLIFFTTFPSQAKAQYVDISNAVKEYVADPIVYVLMDKLLRKVTDATVNWINTGFKGNPSYITNPGQFFLNVADETAGHYLSKPALKNLCAPFNPQVRVALVKNYLNTDENNTCTLSVLKNNYDAFTSDFAQGGWDGWFEMTQNPNNNPYGSYIAYNNQLRSQNAVTVTKYANQIIQGRGFLSVETCPEGQAITQADIDADSAANTVETVDDFGNPIFTLGGSSMKIGDCKVKKETKTPGSVIEGSLQKVLPSGLDKLKVADEVNEIVGALYSQLVTMGLKGLRDITSNGSGKNAYSTQVKNEDVRNDENYVNYPDPSNVDMTPGSMTCTVSPDRVDSNGNRISDGITTCNITTGMANLCSASPNSRGNDPGAPATIDPNNIEYIKSDISAWTDNGTLNTVTPSPANINFQYSLGSTWNSFDVGGGPLNPAFASAWVLFWRIDNSVPPAASARLLTELATLQTALGKLRQTFVTKSSRIWLKVGDNNGRLGFSDEINPKLDRFVAASDPVDVQDRLIDSIANNDVPKYPLVWSYISKDANAVQKQIDDFKAVYDNLNNYDKDATAADVNDLDVIAMKAIPAIDTLLKKVNDIISPPPPGRGRWIAYPFDYLTNNKPNDVAIAGLFCNGQDFEPKAGETYGFMLSTPAGNASITDDFQNAREKTSITSIVWPAGITRPVPTNNGPIGTTGLPTYGQNTSGGTAQCSAGLGNDPGAPNTINEDQIIWDDADISSWPVTATLSSISTAGTQINFPFDKANSWPSITPPSIGAPVIGNLWVVVWRSGAWHASTFGWIRPGQTSKPDEVNNLLGADDTLVSPLGNFTAKTGDLYGFVVSTPARGGNFGPVSEKSNVVTKVWDGLLCTPLPNNPNNPNPNGPPQTPPPPSTGPQAPTITSVNPTSVTPGVTTITINGTNLQNTLSSAVNVVFLDSNGRSTVSGRGTVNTTGTQTTVTVPSGLVGTSGYILIDNGTGLVSNSIPITYIPNVTATVSSFAATPGFGGTLTFNSSANNWFVASAPSGTADNNIYGRIMDNTGTAVSPQFIINSTANPSINNRAPYVAYDPDINKYLAVYISFTAPVTINGQFFNPDGTKSGNPFIVFSDAPGGFSFLEFNTRLVYNQTKRQFAFVWNYRTPAVGANLVTISETGVVSPVVSMPGSPVQKWWPTITVNTSTGEYCIAYDERDVSKIVLRTYNSSTGTLGPETFINNVVGTTVNVVYNSVNNKFMLGWTDNYTASKASILTSCNGASAGNIFVSNTGGATQQISYNAKSNTYATIAQGPGFGNQYQIISGATGLTTKTGIAFAGGTTGNFWPQLFGNSTDGTFAAITAQDFNPTMFAPGL